ncbi:flp pilus assembly protein : Flp pilus assembly protein TadD OS=Singulisphaera acidiphila (strain ATCC BAA-1392 / DSM 18658 / VKM B-2454 / MOB10) GN=Sinac_4781 PE=4 SV=1: TPR_16: TPR_16: TPR_11: TPR_10: TPR_12: Glyco_transf_9 [Gemmataceae bacterium]|nr:flp pilus assembly protein : Flp pilus assembly protein TadD OS=Singulisphaera acidiphila (strain ATCC BAA-1392 / DSM 18658 / VKM B-2454 / MOB10) GN=Sinac_4781 PE=4 SV=1: TPR_16: TPR_16: TPR_11: TPR_10: TPR_12: Glyco_transf_9 [Gemmataceae bacterium]VTU02538.1 flp pilus assembly protein : Flp pilus assembly protein TadD OS=Singulisphaera acidiphila (strain ATCC BAA-1392 / DSM 18658 / VKM B-2454 / MOB10) GN=Sinac_4781 PE=4 SV=1: TPR_16: TPR_16: TPR_11: TPR_10: TPR_12: Glyco_transf_9 [Gemmataceae 
MRENGTTARAGAAGGVGPEGAGAAASGDAHLLRLFADLAREAGRDALAAEFAARAAGTAPAAPAGPDDPAARAAAHHREGVRLGRDGRPVDAEVELRRAVVLDPGRAEAHGDLGVALARLGRVPEAEAAFRVAARLAPAAPAACVNLATALLQQGRHREAEEWARQAVHLGPTAADAHRLLGWALEGRNHLAEAEPPLREAVRLDPRLADAHYRLGVVLARTARPAEAEAAYREAVRLRPGLAAAWAALAQLLEGRNRAAEGEACAREAVRLDPASAEYRNTLGVALATGDKPEEAEAAYREAIRLNPQLASAHSNLGNTLRVLDRLEEGERSLREALRLWPRYPEAHNNLGILLVQMGRPDEGMRHYEEALRLRPDYPEARMNRSLCWLTAGDFARGWPEYEWRWRLRGGKPPALPAPRWDGGPPAGRTVLVTAEQGLGDCVHFLRYAAPLKAAGATVVFDCPGPLVGLARTCPGVDRVVAQGEPIPACDAHAPLLSLPGLLGNLPPAAAAPVPYLRPDPDRVAFWRAELARVPGFKVGVAWQGSKAHKGDRRRSVRLTQFAPLAAVPGVTLCSLQKGAGSEQLGDPAAAGLGVVDLGGRTAADLGDAAALMLALDLVVCVDTALAHLAGALGRPVWVAVPFSPDWRWGAGGRTPTGTRRCGCYRQPARGTGAGVRRLAADLAAAAAGRPPGPRRGERTRGAVRDRQKNPRASISILTRLLCATCECAVVP